MLIILLLFLKNENQKDFAFLTKIYCYFLQKSKINTPNVKPRNFDRYSKEKLF